MMKLTLIAVAWVFLCGSVLAQTDSLFVDENFQASSPVYPILDKGIVFDLSKNPAGLFIEGVQNADDFHFTIRSIEDSLLFESFDNAIRWAGEDDQGGVLPVGTYLYSIESDGSEANGELLLSY